MKFALCAFVALGSIVSAPAGEKAASATGTWTWAMPGRDGGEERKYSLALVQDGEKLTGKVKAPGRDGATTETEIAEGTVKDGAVSFTVTREWNGNKRTSPTPASSPPMPSPAKSLPRTVKATTNPAIGRPSARPRNK